MRKTFQYGLDLTRSWSASRKLFGELLGFALSDVPTALTVVQRLQEVRRISIVVQPDAAMGGKEAYAAFRPPRIVFSESTYASLQRNEPRARMTLAHEAMHLELHPGSPKARVAGGNASRAFIQPHQSAERQARVSAAAFWMPRQLVRQCESPEEVADRMDVSRQAATIRFDQVNVRDAPKKTSTHIQREIDKLKASVGVDSRMRQRRSVLSDEQQQKLLWAIQDEVPGEDPSEFRSVDNRWVIRWSRFLQARPSGWRIKNGEIIPWEAECRG